MRKYMLTGMLLLVVEWCMAHHGSGSSVGVTAGATTSVLTLKRGMLLTETSVLYWRFKPFTVNTINDAALTGSNLAGINYLQANTQTIYFGITDRITLSGIAPVYNLSLKKYSFEQGNQSKDIRSARFGDFAISTTWQAIKLKNDFVLATISGIELPTGKQNKSGNEILTSVGSGSFDPFVGIVVQKGWNNLTVRSASSYKITTTNADNINFGDFSGSEVWFDYAIRKEKCCMKSTCDLKDSSSTPTKWQVNLLGGIKYEWLEQQRKEKSPILNTGYSRLFLSGGIRIIWSEKVFLPLNFEIPLAENMTGTQNASGWKVSTGISILLNIKKSKQ